MGCSAFFELRGNYACNKICKHEKEFRNQTSLTLAKRRQRNQVKDSLQIVPKRSLDFG